MNNLKYHKEIVDEFKKQFNDIHKKYQRQLQKNNSNRLQIFLHKRFLVITSINKYRKEKI